MTFVKTGVAAHESVQCLAAGQACCRRYAESHQARVFVEDQAHRQGQQGHDCRYMQQGTHTAKNMCCICKPEGIAMAPHAGQVAVPVNALSSSCCKATWLYSSSSSPIASSISACGYKRLPSRLTKTMKMSLGIVLFLLSSPMLRPKSFESSASITSYTRPSPVSGVTFSLPGYMVRWSR